MARAQVVAAMTLGEDRPLHSFFTNGTRRKTSRPAHLERNDVVPVTGPPIDIPSSRADITNNVIEKHGTEACDDEQELYPSVTEQSIAFNIAPGQDCTHIQKVPSEQTLSEHDSLQLQPNKRRRIEPTQSALSWDEQLRSYAQGTLDVSTKASDTTNSTGTLVELDTMQELTSANDHDPLEEDKSSTSNAELEKQSSLSLTSKDHNRHNGAEADTEDQPLDSKIPGETSTSLHSKTSPTRTHGLTEKGGGSLQFNSRGKLVFPGMRSSATDSKKSQTHSAVRSVRGRLPKKLIVTIPYGEHEQSRSQIGRRIDTILSMRHTRAKVIDQATSSRSENDCGKAVHPFFLPSSGRRSRQSGHKDDLWETPVCTSHGSEKTRKPNSCAVTPGKLRAHTQAIQPDSPSSAVRYGPGTNEKKVARPLGPPGAPWPSKGTVHIRGSSSEPPTSFTTKNCGRRVGALEPKERKRKNGVIVNQQVRQASFTEIEKIRASTSLGPRLPTRLVINGKDLQQLVSKELLYDTAQGEIGQSLENIMSRVRQTSISYPCFTQDFERIASTLNAFDQGLRETEPWTQKYAPSNAEQVLESGPEPRALREWLKTLAVKTVDTGKPNDVKMQPPRKDEIARVKKKKRNKRDDIDDFIVSTDDEDDMMEQAERSGDEIPQPVGSTHPKSIFRVRDITSSSTARMTNAVLLSGPHGCGKTATVYAVAKELGFEVFELNAGSRRGGRELLEKVGDMAENHLYQSTTDDPSSLSADEETARLGNALQKDLNSGRQGTMTSFFTPKPSSAAKPSKVLKANAKRRPTARPRRSPSRNPSKQKQSLILLEEVDVLFEEDKQFWLSLTTLAASSKRPIIMTCNDESLVPLDSLNLHAILRFSSPSIDMATDYLLLVAANEGHVIRRSTISDLFLSRKQDLRATIQQLDFWCQMGIGDKKGGLEWIYQRWPPGKDSDAEGNRLRVVSKDTYVESPSSHLETHDNIELVQSGLEGRIALPHHDEDTTRMQIYRNSIKDDVIHTPSRSSRTMSYEMLEEFRKLELAFDCRSAADISYEARSASQYNDALDPTEPCMDEAARANFIEGYQLIQADIKVHFAETDLQLSTYITTRTNSILVQAGMRETIASDQALENERAAEHFGLPKDSVPGSQAQSLQHSDFLAALEPLVDPPTQATAQSVTPGASVLDGPFSPIVEDVAPYVRSIVVFDLALEEQRVRQSNLLSQGGRKAKKARLTRASRSALEGSKREFTRRERWFTKSLNATLVLKTAVHSWTATAEPTPSKETSPETPDM